MVSDSWRAFLREQSPYIRQQRLQSQAFVRGESLTTLALAFNSKSHWIGKPGQSVPAFDHWADLDSLPAINFGVKFPTRTRTVTCVDIDVDAKPLAGDRAWTPELEADAGRLAELIVRAMMKMGIDCRHRFGRHSQKGWGHVYLPIEVAAGKEGLIRLAGLTMKRPIVIGALKVRVEVRLAPDKATAQKFITLPGSVYPSRTGAEFDPTVWQMNPGVNPGFAYPPLPPTPLAKLIKGLYAGLLAAFLAPQWIDGARHDTALLAAGALAREAYDAASILDGGDRDAEEIFAYLLEAYQDPDPKDRMQVLQSSLSAAEAGRAVTGYTKLGEIIGDDAKAVLLRLRGGGDPDQLAALFEQFCWVPAAGGQRNVFLNLAERGYGEVVCDKSAIRAYFESHPHFDDILIGRKRVALIDVAIGRKQMRRYHAAVNLPGMEFQTLLVRENGGYRMATEEEAKDPTAHVMINWGRGFATACPEEPDLGAWERWWKLWKRHIKPLTRGDPVCTAKLEKAIAWGIQFPLEKVPLGLMLTGGQGIGKTVLFEHIIRPIIGESLVTKITLSNLESQWRFADIEGTKFYVIDEANLTQADVSIKEMLKDAMKNTRLRINRKYAAEGVVENFAIPIFLSNEENPGIQIRGQHERALAVIQGETRESKGMTLEQWQAYTNQLGDQVKEFIEALRDPSTREAAMFFFMNIDVNRRDFEDNSDVGDVVDPRSNLTPLQEALCQVFEDNTVHANLLGEYPLTKPFKMEWLLDTVKSHIGERGASRFGTTKHAVTKTLKSMLGDHAIVDHKFRGTDEKWKRLKVFTIKYGTLLARVHENLGVALEPAYELTDADFGDNDWPDAETCRTVEGTDIDRPYSFNKTY